MTIDKSGLDEFLSKALFYYDLPGLAVSVGYGSSGTKYSRAFGTKNVETNEQLEINDIFHMASLAKLFTGTSVMLLWERGLLSLDAPVTHYLDWFGMADKIAEEITVRQLLTHTSGMPDVQDYHWDQPQRSENALENYIRSSEVKDAHLLWNPTEKRFAYSNIGYDLLGLIVAKISGLPFEEFIRKEVFQPLGMDESTFLTYERNLSDICAPHRKNRENKIEIVEYYPYNRSHGPSSTLTSNLRDIEKWAGAHLEKRLLRPETYRLVWEEFAEVPNNGEKICLSWFSRKQGGHQLYGHEGADDGFRSSFWICPELDLFIIISANITNAPLKKISKQIFEMIV